MNPTRITTALFKNQISDEEIPFFRGAMIRLSGDDALFHNHNVDGFNYMYPLVQYKRIKGAAAVIGINQGAEAVERLFATESVFSFGKGVGIHFEFPVTCHILELENPGLSRYKEVELMSFFTVFQCNVCLPENVGLGKSSSVGYGIVNCIEKVK